jgi:hypothetical protein
MGPFCGRTTWERKPESQSKKRKPESFFAHAYLETGIHIKHKFRKRCWGIGQKPYTLETSDLPNSWITSWITFGVESSVSWEGNIHEEILMNLMHSADLLIIRENNSRIRLLFANLLSISGWLEIGEVQGIKNLRSSGIWWSLNSGITVSGDFNE